MSAATSSRVDYWLWENTPISWDESVNTWNTASRTYYTTNAEEKVSLSEQQIATVSKPLQESVHISDDCIRTADVNRIWQETVGIAEQKSAGYAAMHNEMLRARAWFEKQTAFNKTYSEEVSLGEDFSRRVLYANRAMVENIEVGDGADKSYTVVKNESLPSISDALLENANAVIDMVSFFNGVMDEQTFLERANTVQGYSAFKEFYVGDYEYQRALVRLSVQAEQMNSGINLYNVVHNVDIPDTDDRGTVTITDTTAPTKVYFNKFYYHAPEISVTLIGGNTGDGFVIPNITNTNGYDEDGRYFEVELLDVSGTRKTGTLIWVSKGY